MPEDFTQWFPEDFFQWQASRQMGAIILLSLISEDLTCLGAALLSATGSLSLWVAWTGTFLGIWWGDFLLYGFARVSGRWCRQTHWVQGLLARPRIQRAEAWFRDRGEAVLWVCRWVPGTRLPSYLAAGFVRFPLKRFLVVTGIMAAIWTSAIFLATSILGIAVRDWLARMERQLLVVFGFALVLLLLLRLWQRSRWWPSMEACQMFYDRWTRWEFWPAWFFYLPVAVWYVWLAVRYRGWGVPTVANPGIDAGGMVGESKIELLEELSRVAEGHTAEAVLVDESTWEGRCAFFEQVMVEQGWRYPVILKPDVGQRGSGVRKVSTDEGARECLRADGFKVVAQRYAPGPFEAGVFYYRHPGEASGKIFAITDKVFPCVVGDGRSTLGALILDDSRARLMAPVYRARFARRWDEVIPASESFRLVEAGNHAQGCLFRDGRALWSAVLEQRVDQIARALNEFYVGRFDVRYESVEAFRDRGEFQIVELNGAASEATSIYDPENRLMSAYRTLFRQWEIVFSIGGSNISRGFVPWSGWSLVQRWWRYQQEAREHPIAD